MFQKILHSGSNIDFRGIPLLTRIQVTMSIRRHLMRLQILLVILLWLCGFHSQARNCFICNAALCKNGASFDRRFNSINWWPVFIERFYLFRNAFCLKSYKSLLDFILPGFPEVEGKFWSNSIFQIFPWQLENRSRGESLLLWWK